MGLPARLPCPSQFAHTVAFPCTALSRTTLAHSSRWRWPSLSLRTPTHFERNVLGQEVPLRHLALSASPVPCKGPDGNRQPSLQYRDAWLGEAESPVSIC